MTTEAGRIALAIPRDRQATFDPQLIAKCQRRLPGFDDKIVSMYARGMSNREVPRVRLCRPRTGSGHLRDPYGVDLSPDLIPVVIDAVLEEIAAATVPISPKPRRSDSLHTEGSNQE